MTGFILYNNGNNDNTIIRILVISPLFYLGYLWNKTNNKIKYNWTGLLLSISILIIGLFSPYNEINIAVLKLENPFLFIIYSLSGTYMLLCISEYIKNISLLKDLLSYIGSNTLIILLSNYLCLRIFHLIRAYIVDYKGHPTSIAYNETNGSWWVLYTVFMVVVPLSISWSIDYIKSKIKK